MLASLSLETLRALRLTLVFALVTGLIYSLAMTGIAQVLFNGQANGSLINLNGQVVGSSLIGQQFTNSTYFHGRPSANSYAADNSAGSNLAPSNQALIDRVSAAADEFRRENYMAPTDPVPVDIVTTDFSGFDPHISVAAAYLQVRRVAGARGLDQARVKALVDKYTQGRVLGIFGEPSVNVLELNLALDRGEAGS